MANSQYGSMIPNSHIALKFSSGQESPQPHQPSQVLYCMIQVQYKYKYSAGTDQPRPKERKEIPVNPLLPSSPLYQKLRKVLVTTVLHSTAHYSCAEKEGRTKARSE
ncbi:unnamed protein product [Tuber melanosporum]|uniref:(Perigord truffle) hypothetical protein n=1 Tax=Tuber melanosporum (strain Mel28) TaxID=656061 RepID=D5GI05_TUBMM|nr:uncharacterized protein GSTUM_00008217001 [Tuber melanosporum]CAZ84148.1 unnamed protein product [Tuber melanosporum]